MRRVKKNQEKRSRELLHRDNDKPAVIKYRNSKLHQCEWYIHGRLHRKCDQPSVVQYENGEIIAEYWYCRGKLHRHNRPAILHYGDGQIIAEYYYTWGRLGRDRCHDYKPSVVLYSQNRVVEKQWRCGDSLIRRWRGPSIRRYNYISSIVGAWRHAENEKNTKPAKHYGAASNEEKWHVLPKSIDEKLFVHQNIYSVEKWKDSQGHLHCEFGPAKIIRGAQYKEEYYLRGEELEKDEWRNLAKPATIIKQIGLLPYPIATEVLKNYCYC
jgi:hypothetical protein